MKITFFVSGYVPTDNNGATWMAYDIADWLKQRHEVKVITRNAKPGYQDGVEIIQYDITRWKQDIEDADVVITHLDMTAKLHNWTKHTKRNNLYVLIHNTLGYNLLQQRPNQFKAIYNSEYTQNMLLPQPSVLVRPPLVAERYKTKRTNKAKYITLVNCTENKGGHLLIELAKLMPEQKFMGVVGGYGTHIQADLPNLKYAPNTPDMRPIYEQTKILIQPSRYESYGKAVCEAMCNGIPVVVSDTPGLRESTGGAGVIVDRTAEAFRDAINTILTNYSDYSKLATERANELIEQTESDLLNLEQFLRNQTGKQ